MNAPLAASSLTPRRVLFLLSSIPVGGAETLLANLIRRLDRNRILPEVACLKEPGELGEVLQRELPLHSRLLRHKFDVGVIGRLKRLLRSRRIDALVTVGCGDKMFWGRIAAWRARVPVVLSALHSTGWPDGVGRLNRWLTRITDGFIGVAPSHGRYLREAEGFPDNKVFVIPNGVDTTVFKPDRSARRMIRTEMEIDERAFVTSIVAALRPEKNHGRFLRVAQRVLRTQPESVFWIVGDGPLRGDLEEMAKQLGISEAVRFLGTRDDVPQLLAASDAFLLTSDNEANPVSILEAMACELPVIAPRVGSIHEAVLDGRSGYLFRVEDEETAADLLGNVIGSPGRARAMAKVARNHVLAVGSVSRMVQGYTELIERIYQKNVAASKS